MNLSRANARLDAVLHQFQAISTAEEPYNYGRDSCLGDSPRKSNFPSLYLSRSTDKGLMKMQGEGQAMVQYKIKSRSIDENTDDGVPLYGASIEIRSIEPVAGGGESELSETLFLRHFGVARDRDGEGRYAAGNVPGADDYAIAAAARKKKVAVGVGAGGVLAAAALGVTPQGRAAGKSLLQGAGRVLRR